MIRLENVKFSYRGTEVLCGVSLNVNAGEMAVITGKNGCGKTTLMKIVSGALVPEAGTVAVAKGVGYIPQTPSLFEDMTVRENLAFFAALSGGKIPKALPMGVEAFLEKRVKALSGGMKKRASIACALISNPQIVLFDEPDASLDAAGAAELTGLLSELLRKGCAVLYIGHMQGGYDKVPHTRYILRDGMLSLRKE